MLRQYGPDVNEETLGKLARAFSELRDMADQGLLSYPYSTRELVNIVKHLQVRLCARSSQQSWSFVSFQKYKTDGVPLVVGNVFDFDAYDKDVEETVCKILAKHGFPIAGRQRHVEVKLAERYPIEQPRKIGRWGVMEDAKAQKLAVNDGLLKLTVRRVGLRMGFGLYGKEGRCKNIQEHFDSFRAHPYAIRLYSLWTVWMHVPIDSQSNKRIGSSL